MPLPSPTFDSLTLGSATGGNQGSGTLNLVGLYVNGVPFTGGGGTPGGSTGQIQVNNNGTFGGLPFTGSGSVVLATSPTITGLTLTGGTADNVVIGGVTPAAGSFTNLNFTGALRSNGTPLSLITAADSTIAITSGSIGLAPIAAATLYGNVSGSAAQPAPIQLDSSLAFLSGKLGTTGTLSQVNLTTATGLLLNGVSIINMTGNAQSIVIGPNAGVSLPAVDTETVAIGPMTLNAYAATTGENTVIGWFSARSLTGAMCNLTTTATTTAGTTLTFADTQISQVGGFGNGFFATGSGIPAGTTVSSFTSTTITLSAAVTVASGTVVSLSQFTATTTATTTAGPVLTFAATTGIVAGQVVIGAGITGVVQVISTTGTTVTLGSNVTVASGTPLYFGNASGKFNAVVGVNAMGLSTIDGNNCIFGTDTMRNSTGSNNAMFGCTIARDGIHHQAAAFGSGALGSHGNTASFTINNVAIGYQAMAGAALTTGSQNVVAGSFSGRNITSAGNSVLLGFQVAPNLTSGASNVGVGYLVYPALTTGGANVSLGPNSMAALVSGSFNVGAGRNVLSATISGGQHTSIGDSSMANWAGTSNSTSLGNVAMGAAALQGAVGSTFTANVGIGVNTGKLLSSGSANLLLGPNVASVNLTTGGGNIYLGNSNAIDAPSGVGSESNTFRLGNNAVNLMRGTAINTAAPAFFLDWMPGSTTFANDAAAATGGVSVGQLYRNGSAVMCRVA